MALLGHKVNENIDVLVRVSVESHPRVIYESLTYFFIYWSNHDITWV